MNGQLPTATKPSIQTIVSVEALLESAADDPTISTLLEALFIGNQRLLTPMLQMLRPEMIDEYLDSARVIWNAISAMSDQDPSTRLDEIIKGLQFHSVDFLRRQVAFARTGDYQAEDAQTVYEEVYHSASVMKEYLDGLLLTYIAWPNHYRLLQFYRDSYLAQGPSGRCLEVGPGHGFLALLQIQSHEDNTLLGIDISPYSVAYSKECLAAAGVDGSRFEIRLGDATDNYANVTECFDRIVMAEVLEHVEQPQTLLRSAVKCSHDQTLIFLSTVVNIEAIDHLYLYRSIEEVRQMIDDCGLTIVEELDMPLEFASEASESYEVALICRPKPK
ncbi:MAG: class I SAM-dependent methyltransferase [Planctomycetes bacterium]|nr:class I SAM-dependent methyltransferase [Planctomycetota bacterium]